MECYASICDSCSTGPAEGLFRGGQACQTPPVGYARPLSKVYAEDTARVRALRHLEKDGLSFLLFGFCYHREEGLPVLPVSLAHRGAALTCAVPRKSWQALPIIQAAWQHLLADDKPL